MDKDTTVRTMLAIALMLGVMLAWNYFFPPPQPMPAPPVTEEQAAPPASPSPAAEGSPAVRSTGESSNQPEPAPAQDAVLGGENQPPVEVRTATQELTLTARGGTVLTWKLLGYEREPGDPDAGPVDLVSPESRRTERPPLAIRTGDSEVDRVLNESWYVVDTEAPTEEELRTRTLPQGTSRVRFRFADGRGLEATKTLWIGADGDYLSRLEWNASRNGAPIPNAAISWGPGVARAAKGDSTYVMTKESAVVDVAGSQERYEVDDLSGSDLLIPESRGTRSLSLDERYFSIAMIPIDGGTAAVRLLEPGKPESKEDGLEPRRIVIESTSQDLWLFTGPKLDPLLKQVDARLDTRLSETIQWGFFGIVARPLYLVMASIQDVVKNWGLAIVLITVAIRLLFVPLTHKSMISMRRTQEQMGKLQPKIRKIREKYQDKRDRDSRMKMSEEMMDLYKREGINPMSSVSGCLPLLLQLPVLWAMLSVLTVVIELRGAHFFGWLADLSAPDPIYVTPVLMGLTMFGQQLMSMAKTDDPQQRTQQRIMLFMPLMFTYFFLWAPSGLVIYWLVNSVLGIGQQVFVNRHAAAAKKAATAS